MVENDRFVFIHLAMPVLHETILQCEDFFKARFSFYSVIEPYNGKARSTQSPTDISQFLSSEISAASSMWSAWHSNLSSDVLCIFSIHCTVYQEGKSSRFTQDHVFSVSVETFKKRLRAKRWALSTSCSRRPHSSAEYKITAWICAWNYSFLNDHFIAMYYPSSWAETIFWFTLVPTLSRATFSASFVVNV